MLTDPTQKYYAYARVSKTEQVGEFRLSPTPVGTESESGFYHLLLGILNSEFDGVREYMSLHGYTEILPGRITTDRIVSADGKTYFNLAEGRIGGRITLEEGSSGLENIPEFSELQKDKDQIAKGIGYANYQDMLDKIGPDGNQTIIDGGFIRTNIIDVENLYAKNIRTAVSGKRVEILGMDKRLSVFDDPDPATNKPSEERVRISGDTAENFIPQETEYVNTKAVATRIGSTRRLIDSSFPRIEIYDTRRSERICDFKYKKGDSIRINELKFNNSISITDGVPNRSLTARTVVEATLLKCDAPHPSGSVWVPIAVLNSISSTKTNDSSTHVLLPRQEFPDSYGEGRFAINISIESSSMLEPPEAIDGPVGTQAGYVVYSYSFEVPSTIIEVSENLGSYSALYSNGLVSHWGSSKYFGVLQLPDNDFIRAVDGQHGFKLDKENGFLVSTNTNASTPNWNMPMNCVLMGKVNGYGTMLSCRSCSPNLRAAASWVKTGRYAISFKNQLGSISNYFSTANDYVAVIFPKSDVSTAYGLFEASSKTASTFHCSTVRYDRVAADFEFVFFVIDIRNWTL